jgi:hypothetical protein
MVAWHRGVHKNCVTKQLLSFRSEPPSRPLSPNIAAVGTGFELKYVHTGSKFRLSVFCCSLVFARTSSTVTVK